MVRLPLRLVGTGRSLTRTPLLMSLADPLAPSVLLFIAHIASCLVMTGVIWVVQLVHYPAFYWVKRPDFPEFIRFHGWCISYIVLPVMVVELLTAAALVWAVPEVALIGNLLGVIAIWGVTLGLSIPCHARLAKGYHAPTIARLIATNWWRTVLWTIRAVALIGWGFSADWPAIVLAAGLEV